MRPRFLRRETLEPAEQAALRGLLAHGARGDLFADVGAYHGAYARAARAQGLDVICFEADPRNAKHLRGFAVVRAVVGDRLEPVTFASRGSQVSGAADIYYSPSTVYTVAPVVTLDALFSLEPRTPRLMKVDVEGYEAKVLRGARAVLAGVAAVLVEIHPGAMRLVGDDADAVRDALDGFAVTVLDEDRDGGRAHWLAVRER